MRIDRLDIKAFGNFTNSTLDLSAGTQGMHVIYGDNEAGKSTSLRALIAWLFGIPLRTSDNYLHSNSQLRIGGRLRLSNGDFIEFDRRKGVKGTLLAPGTDAALDDAVLLPYLPGIDENLFTKLYGIDYNRLVAGGKELLEQSGNLGQALFSAAVGTASLREILAELQNGAEELFKPRATTKIVNQAIANFKEAQKRIKESSLPVAEWKRLQQELTGILSAISQVEEKIAMESKEKSRLNRLNRVKVALAERREVMTHLEKMGDAVLLPEDFDEKRKEAVELLHDATVANARAESRLSRLAEESQLLNIRDELLDNEKAILDLHKKLGAVEKNLEDRPQQDAKRRQYCNEAEKLLKCVRPEHGIDGAEQLRPLTTRKELIFRLAKENSLLNQKKEAVLAALRDLEDEQKINKNKLKELPQSDQDLNELKAAIVAARKHGDLEQRLADTEKRAADEKVACEQELLRLGRFTGTIKALTTTPMPLDETMNSHERKFDELAEIFRHNAQCRNQLEEEQRQAKQDLRALLLTGDVPTISDLETARSERNTGWNLIKKKYIEGIDPEEEIAAYAPNGDLPTLYEKKIDSADTVSDQMRSAAGRVVKRADIEARMENLKTDLSILSEKEREAGEKKEASQQEWDDLWEPLEVNPGTPREMKEWLAKVNTLLAHVQSAYVIAGDARKLAEECNTLKQAVTLQIRTFDDSIELQKMSLESMINLCAQRVEHEESARQRVQQLQQALRDSETHINRKREALKSIETEQAIWIQEWTQAIDGLGLQPDAHPEQATETFELLVKFFDALDKSEEQRQRIYGMDLISADFEKKVYDFADRIGYKREGVEAKAITAQLNQDLSKAKEARASLERIKQHEKELKEEIESATLTIRTAEQQLAVLREQAQVETNENLESAGEDSRKMRQLQQKLAALEQELTRNGDGLSLQELEHEADEADFDAIEGELEKVSFELRELQAERDKLRDLRQTLQNAIQAKDGSAAAANASEEAEQQLATMSSAIEQYLRLRIAALILVQRIEDYRKKNQAPVLARAGEIFSRLTLGSFANLRDELDESGKPVLLGVRPDKVEVPVEGMSDGTRDQLYLSLRLATLEQHLKKGEPMPFVVDDILIGFDDSRTRVSLEILAALATRTQVLLFTHHRRVLDLAEALAASTEIFTHQLSRQTGSSLFYVGNPKSSLPAMR